MKNHKQKGESNQKRPYVKPEVKQVQLKPEEAVLGFCKQAGQGGPQGIGCPRGTPPYRCQSFGS